MIGIKTRLAEKDAGQAFMGPATGDPLARIASQDPPLATRQRAAFDHEQPRRRRKKTYAEMFDRLAGLNARADQVLERLRLTPTTLRVMAKLPTRARDMDADMVDDLVSSGMASSRGGEISLTAKGQGALKRAPGYMRENSLTVEKAPTGKAQKQKQWLELWQRVRKAVSEQEHDLKIGTSDGMWDGAQGFSDDIASDGRKMLKLAKEINAMRDARGKGTPWG